MSDMEIVTALIAKFSSNDAFERRQAHEILRAMGRSALGSLSKLRFRQEGDAYTEVFKAAAAIGDDLYTAEGPAGLDKEILDMMVSGARKIRPYASEEVYTCSVEALMRWGQAVPLVLVQPVYACHMCGRKSTDLRVDVCALHTCAIPVCRDHAHIIPTRFGEFDGSGGAWFCTAEHLAHANKHFIDWN